MRHIAASVIRELRVLVETVGLMIGRIANVVIAIRMENRKWRMENCVRHLATDVVGEGIGVAGDGAA